MKRSKSTGNLNSNIRPLNQRHFETKRQIGWYIKKENMMSLKRFINRTFILAALIIPGLQDSAFSQERFNLSLGIGVPEFIHIGGRYQFNQCQLGLGMGLIPATDESLISVTSDFYYHFAGTSSLSQRRLWFARTGLVFIRDNYETAIDDYLYLNLRLGRDINLNRKMGLALDAGAIFQLLKETREKNPPGTGWDFDLNFPVLPAFGIGVFYRI